MNGTLKLKDLNGLRLLGYYNISKIKKYECALWQSEEKQREESEEAEAEEADIHELGREDLKQLFQEYGWMAEEEDKAKVATGKESSSVETVVPVNL